MCDLVDLDLAQGTLATGNHLSRGQPKTVLVPPNPKLISIFTPFSLPSDYGTGSVHHRHSPPTPSQPSKQLWKAAVAHLVNPIDAMLLTKFEQNSLLQYYLSHSSQPDPHTCGLFAQTVGPTTVHVWVQDAHQSLHSCPCFFACMSTNPIPFICRV